MKKLNLGCGDRKLHGFINVDARADVAPDAVCDVRHVLEHFPSKPFPFQPVTWKEVIQSWHQALKPGGVLRISVPDLRAACEYYLATNDFESVKAFFYGGQKYDFDFHYHGWTLDTLSIDLKEVGFKEVRKYDWRKTEHFYVDDYSQAYLPHMDKINGRLMSLNVEAVK